MPHTAWFENSKNKQALVLARTATTPMRLSRRRSLNRSREMPEEVVRMWKLWLTELMRPFTGRRIMWQTGAGRCPTPGACVRGADLAESEME